MGTISEPLHAPITQEMDATVKFILGLGPWAVANRSFNPS